MSLSGPIDWSTDRVPVRLFDCACDRCGAGLGRSLRELLLDEGYTERELHPSVYEERCPHCWERRAEDPTPNAQPATITMSGRLVLSTISSVGKGDAQADAL